MNIVISMMGRFQTNFWLGIAKNLSLNKSISISFICFDSESYEITNKSCFKTYKGWVKNDFTSNKETLLNKIKKLASKNKISLKNHFFHEKICFGFKSYNFLIQRLMDRYYNCEKILGNFEYESNTIVIQELGGYLCNLSLFLAARNKNFTNYYIEPSLFSDRYFLLKNTYSGPVFFENKIPENIVIKNKLSVLKKVNLEKFLKEKPVSVPKIHQQRIVSPIFRLFSRKNIKRALEKYISSIFFKKHYEFGSINYYIYNFILITINSILLKPFYLDILSSKFKNKKIIYYPLHVPSDMSLTIREPKFFNQLSLCKNILEEIGDDKVLVIKEHPTMKGSLNFIEFLKLKIKYKNLFLINPKISNYKITRISNLVYTVNSKAGFEAILQGTETKVLGRSFYKNFSKSNEKSILKSKAKHLLQSLYAYSSKGSLFSDDLEDIKEMSNTLLELLE
tara:strand:- start:7983 stop:9335 length:1353 start_codon:yes stop_codon:yes gene_type:complete